MHQKTAKRLRTLGLIEIESLFIRAELFFGLVEIEKLVSGMDWFLVYVLKPVYFSVV